MTSDTLNQFEAGYVSCIMWLTTDDDGDSIDGLGLEDMAPEALDEIHADCEAFLADNLTDMDWYLTNIGDHHSAGHDFYLTRNGHGAGFWDRSYATDAREPLLRLSDSARVYGTSDGDIGDDGLVYVT